MTALVLLDESSPRVANVGTRDNVIVHQDQDSSASTKERVDGSIVGQLVVYFDTNSLQHACVLIQRVV